LRSPQSPHAVTVQTYFMLPITSLCASRMTRYAEDRPSH
jgi:hypothetical protein